MEIQGEPLSQEFLNFSGQSTWTSCNKSEFFIYFELLCVREPPLQEYLNFRGPSHELLAKCLFRPCLFVLFSYMKNTPCSSWTASSFHFELLCYFYFNFTFLFFSKDLFHVNYLFCKIIVIGLCRFVYRKMHPPPGSTLDPRSATMQTIAQSLRPWSRSAQ